MKKLYPSIVGQKIFSHHIGIFVEGAVDRVDRWEAQVISWFFRGIICYWVAPFHAFAWFALTR